VTGRPNDLGCIPNIGERGRRRRQLGGAVFLVVGIAAAVAMTILHEPPSSAIILFIPFTLAALGFFQARERT
jgi:hypothetical protein